MRGSLKLFTMFGIPVHLHWTFGLIILYAVYLGYSSAEAPGEVLFGTIWIVGFFLAIFACVLFHEFGHSLTARKYGVETQDIILTPIGGIARLERMPEKPFQEFVVAIAGPLVNVAIAILLLATGYLLYSGESWEIFSYILEKRLLAEDLSTEYIEDKGIYISNLLNFLPLLITVNVALFVFNLIPAFPMDGGRIFRALLAMRIGRVRATRAASLVGQGLAVLFVVFGLMWGQFTLTLIGVFVFTTARAENSMVQIDHVLRSHTAGELVRTNFSFISEADWMQTALQTLQQGTERSFIVTDMQEKPIGVLREQDIISASKKKDLSTPIREYTQQGIASVRPDDTLYLVYMLLRQERKGLVAVVEDGMMKGVIDDAGLETFMRLNNVK